ncbi:NIPSNAP family protein [Bosea sp. (in: a-proteobacteria)]|uniref:NIPSNAP family protein n=1 Tax=Bosea sp. (in: a-proteobacteria) TaxID=1871050 RepID=UPI0031FEA012
MIIEHRTYVVEHGRTEEYLERYRQLGLPVQQKYLGRLLGVFVSEIGRLNEVLYIWVYDSLADREERRAQLDADPAWHVAAPSSSRTSRSCATPRSARTDRSAGGHSSIGLRARVSISRNHPILARGIIVARLRRVAGSKAAS